MSMLKLAVINFKSSFKNYLALIISLAFTILIFLNFQNIIYSHAFDSLGKMNKRNIDIVVQAITIVLCCFMFFFIWYSTNVFLTKRKKEIGIYVFMGLTNQKIGKLYMIETFFIGLSALAIGLIFGLITSQLFQMILMAVSEIAIDIQFDFSLTPILFASTVYLIIYSIFVVKGYISIVRSSVLEMVSATRQNEYVQQNQLTLIIKTILGILILSTGFYFAIKDGGMEVMSNVLLAVVLVIVGIYLLFGGFIPLVFQTLVKNKRFLYQKERNLWINNMIFRIKKNYRTYAIVCILMLCSVTALATGFAMRNRHHNIVHFRNTYTYQVISNQDNLDTTIKDLISQDNTIDYSNHLPILQIDASLWDTLYQDNIYMLVSYSKIKQLALDTHLEFNLSEPKDDEIIQISQLHLLSIITDNSNITETINGKTYKQIDSTTVPYLGSFQENFSFYLVNDEVYKTLKPLGIEYYSYNYHIKDIQNFNASIDALNTLLSETEENYTAYQAIDPNSSDIEWIKVMYSICIFMFMVFILASGSILFMKLYNDAFEEKSRYEILNKIGISSSKLKKAIAKELGFAYSLPFITMSIASYFSVHALSKMMQTNLLSINIISIFVILIFFIVCYLCSVVIYSKNANIK